VENGQVGLWWLGCTHLSGWAARLVPALIDAIDGWLA
jgi:hypothetical protein